MTRFDPSILSDVLVLLADLDDARILPRRTVSIAIDRVLAWSWNPGRLERCQQKLAAVVGSETDCHPERYRLDCAGRRLWQEHNDERFGHCLKLLTDGMRMETMTVLLAVGVPYKDQVRP